MIVKNESRIIDRCLDAALPFVDAYVIVDTGSTDDTVARIKTAAERHGARGVVSSDEWRNFGHNRSRAAKLTRDYAKERGFDLNATYMLCLDADMVLKSSLSFDPASLHGACYQLEQRSPFLSWWNTRLCKLSHEWVSVGVTHEYWAPFPDASLEKLEELFIEDIGDGGAKGDKHSRDIKLLLDGLREEPDNVRYLFYLAQSYFDLGDFAKAIPLYKRRRALGGWDEEVWFSLYKIGLAQLQSDSSKGIETLLQAHNERPTRAEALVSLAEHFRTQSANALAVLFAKAAQGIAVSKDSLFVEIPAYTYRPLNELSIASYYVPGEEHGGFVATEELLACRETPAAERLNVQRTMTFYAPTIAQKSKSAGTFTVSETLRTSVEPRLGLVGPNTTEYLPKNPSIVRLGDGELIVSVNLVNYHHERGVVFQPKDRDGMVRTRNVILRGYELEDLEHETEIAPEQWPDGWDPEPRVRGLEDMRLFTHEGQVWFTATCFHPPGGRARVVLGRLSSELDRVEHLVELTYGAAGDCEKNWLPFSRGEKLFAIYSYDPLVVLEVDMRTGNATEYARHASPRYAGSWRGGAPPCEAPGRLLTVVHEVAHFDDRRVYLHRFVELDGDFQLSRCSRPFGFDHIGVEYATGLLRLHDVFVVTYGSEEREARWMRLHRSVVDDMLEEGSR